MCCSQLYVLIKAFFQLILIALLDSIGAESIDFCDEIPCIIIYINISDNVFAIIV